MGARFVPTETITFTGFSLSAEGTTYHNANTLPAGWEITSYGTDGLKAQLSVAATRRGNQVGTATITKLGQMHVSYSCTSTSPTFPTKSLWFEWKYTTGAEARTYRDNCYASARGVIVKIFESEAKAHNNMDEVISARTKIVKRIASVSWQGNANNWTLAHTAVFPVQKSHAKAYNATSSGGNSTVASALSTTLVGAAPYWYDAAPRFASGSTNVTGELFAEVSLNGITQSSYVTTPDAGSAEFAFDLGNDSYVLKVHATGFLQKAVPATLSATPLSGLNLTLKFGDLDGDNYVSQAEVDFVQASIGADLNDPDVEFDANHPFDIMLCDADGDGDGDVGSDDYQDALANLGLYGD